MEEIIVKIFEVIANATGLDIAMIGAIFAILFGVSEILGKIEKVKANGVFQTIKGIIAALFNKFTKKP